MPRCGQSERGAWAPGRCDRDADTERDTRVPVDQFRIRPSPPPYKRIYVHFCAYFLGFWMLVSVLGRLFLLLIGITYLVETTNDFRQRGSQGGERDGATESRDASNANEPQMNGTVNTEYMRNL